MKSKTWILVALLMTIASASTRVFAFESAVPQTNCQKAALAAARVALSQKWPGFEGNFEKVIRFSENQRLVKIVFFDLINYCAIDATVWVRRSGYNCNTLGATKLQYED